MARPTADRIVPAELIRAAYLDLDTPLRVSAARLGTSANNISQRGTSMKLPSRQMLLATRARQETTRRCTCCGEVKPATLDHFYADTRQSSGLKHWCRACCAVKARERLQPVAAGSKVVRP